MKRNSPKLGLSNRMNNLALNRQGRKTASTDGPYRVVIIEDSAVIRGMEARWLSEDPNFEVVARYANGKIAVDRIHEVDAEIAILDIEMPEMDGLTALPLLLKKVPDLKIIMASTLTVRNADISMQALSLGAVDYVPKPETVRGVSESSGFRQELLDKLKVLGEAARKSGRPGRGRFVAQPRKSAGHVVNGNQSLQKASAHKPTILAIGSSTGGPQALMKLFTGLRGKINCPIVITQHMPPMFTSIMAEHLHKVSGLPAKEAQDREVIRSGTIYIAPGDYHMTINKSGTQTVINLNQDAPENFCRPAVDPMFRSLAKSYGSRALCVVLTGMGSDGQKGGEHIVKAGGTIIAQDEASSVVWGMPGAVATAGLCSAILPLDKIGQAVERSFEGVDR